MFRQDLDLRVFRVSLRRRGEQLLVEITIVSREERRGRGCVRACVRAGSSSLVQSDGRRGNLRRRRDAPLSDVDATVQFRPKV